MIARLAHLCIHVQDVNRSIDFYSTKLGLPVKFTFEKNGKLNGAYFGCGGNSYIEIFEVPYAERVNTSLQHFCLETEDIDAFIADVRSRGVACTDKSLGCDETWQAWMEDPDGNKFEVHQYTPRSFQHQGGVAVVNW